MVMDEHIPGGEQCRRRQKLRGLVMRNTCKSRNVFRGGTLSLCEHLPIIFGASVKKCNFFHRPTIEPVALSGSGLKTVSLLDVNTSICV